MADQFWGYRYEDENLDQLVLSAVPFRYLVDGEYTAPDEIDPRPWHVIEDQSSLGSCNGHSASSCEEYAYRIATAGQAIQFSEMFAYLTAQKEDGFLGSDSGSTINGALQASKKYGCCPVDVFPYPVPAKYSTRIPEDAWTAAKPFKINYHAILTSYEDMFAFLAAGQGGVNVGMPWNGSMSPRQGVIENPNPNAGGGGHAIAFLGYSKRVDSDGRKYLWQANSWGVGWGNQGWAEWSPAGIDKVLRHRWSVAIGMSDLTVPEPRKVDWHQWESVV